MARVAPRSDSKVRRISRSRACVSTWIVTSSGMQVLARSACARNRTRSAKPTGKPTSISLKPISHQRLEHPQLARDVHRLDQRLVAVAQVGAAPDRRAGSARRRARCGPSGATGAKARYLLAGLLQHGMDFSLWLGCNQQPQRKTARCWCKRAVSRGICARAHRLRP